MENYYEMMGITSNYPQEAIAQAFRSKIKEVHPDKCQNQENISNNKDATIRLYEAYRVLNDPNLRKQYDQKLKQIERSKEIVENRYFQQSSLVEENGYWRAQCQQCLGKTLLSNFQVDKLAVGDRTLYVKCMHCTMPLCLSLD